MSRNLVHYNLEKLEMLPYRGGIRDCTNTSLEVKRGTRYHYKQSLQLQTASAILHGSVGRDFSSIYQRIKSLVRNSGYNWFHTHINTLNRNGDITDRRGISDYGIYIDKDNILRNHPWRKIKPSPRIYDARKHYAYQAKRRKDRKELIKSKREAGLALLRLINKPDLYKFYLDLSFKKKGLTTKIYEKPDRPPVIEYYKEEYVRGKGYVKSLRDNPKAYWLGQMKYWKYCNEAIVKNAIKARRDIIPIIDQMTELEKGNYNQFFESNAYLYSLQKSCHHYEQP